MRKVMPRFKWHWFLSPLPTACVATAFAIASVSTLHPDLGSRVVAYSLFVYVGIVVVWTLLVLILRREDPKHVFPPMYFVVFWIIILILELGAMIMFDYLGIGQFQGRGFL